MPLLELVPNVSEGCRTAVLAEIAEAFCVPGVRLLDVDASTSANRTVLTLAGEAEPLVRGAVRGARACVETLDLRSHRGVHPRMGALDVCPFVPLGGATMEDAVRAAWEAADAIASLGVPSYVYGAAARVPAHVLLHDVRRGQFEGLREKMSSDPPDRGDARPHPTAGATAVGARFFLVAFNVNLATEDVRVARRIARRVREWSSRRRDEAGRVVAEVPGRLPSVRAIGWHVEDLGCVQVSTNLVDYRVTPPHVLLAAVEEEAEQMGTRVTGAELVGCIPLEPLRMAAWAGGAPREASDEVLVARGIEALRLNAVKAFEPRDKVLEWALRRQGLELDGADL